MIREPDGGSSWEKVGVSLDQDMTAVSHVASWAAGGYRCYSDVQVLSQDYSLTSLCFGLNF